MEKDRKTSPSLIEISATSCTISLQRHLFCLDGLVSIFILQVCIHYQRKHRYCIYMFPNKSYHLSSTTWVSSIYYKTHPDRDSGDWSEGARAGSFALLCYAITSVVAGVTLPTLTTHAIPHITLKNVWTFSLLVFSIAMLSTHFVANVTGATVILSLLGISWACIMWIPFALVGEYLNFYDRKRLDIVYEPTLSPTHYGAINRVANDHATASSPSVEEIAETVDNDWIQCSQCESGMVLGMLNMYVVFPQFVIAIIASSIFYFIDLVDSPSNDSTYTGISILLQFSGLMALIATGLSRFVVNVDLPPGRSTHLRS